MEVDRNLLELNLNNSTFYTGGDTLSGTVHLVVKEPLGIDVKTIKAQLVCAVEVNIDKYDQIRDENNKSVSNRTKPYESEINLVSSQMHLDFGTHDFQFSFSLPWCCPTFPPTCSDRINSETNASISHYVKASVSRGQAAFLKNELSTKTYFSFIPRSLVASILETEETGFVFRLPSVSSQGRRKAVDKPIVDSTKPNYSKLNPCGRDRDKKLARITKSARSGSMSHCEKEAPELSLICGLILPSKGIRQDCLTDFNLSITTANKNDIVMIKSLKISLHTILTLKVGDYTHESMTEMTNVYQKSMSMTGNQTNIQGQIGFNSPLLPSFETPHISHSHTLEIQVEVSQVADCEIQEPNTFIEVIPINLFSHFTLPMNGANLYRSIFDEEFATKEILTADCENQTKAKCPVSIRLEQDSNEDLKFFNFEEHYDVVL